MDYIGGRDILNLFCTHPILGYKANAVLHFSGHSMHQLHGFT